ISGEESFQQTRMRARRLGALSDNLLVLSETEIEVIDRHLTQEQYDLVVVDSIQSVYSSEIASVPGSVSQVRECANALLRIAKSTDVPIFLVGHVTKEGAIAGPRVLEHLVDTVLYFEGEDKQALRILRGVKNRFGSTNEIGVFEMTEAGLREVPNPSALFLNERPRGVSGSIVIPSIEGTRPLLVEVQALVGDTSLASPRRTVTGVNPNRVSLLLAVLEKRAGLHVSDKDVFVNVAGGVKLDEPAVDVAIAIALTSSLLGAPAATNVIAFGEVGLAGEIRAVNMSRARVAEGVKFGFTKCILPKGSVGDVEETGVDLMPVTSIGQAIDLALER
ncbi:MAG: DNA repair protein RadA, partial [FCB group bacterium]|nr:DNA repair protein RadA [FCB group bacterium]